MRRIRLVGAAVLASTIAGLLGAGLYVHARSTSASTCMDPTAPCWTQGGTSYQGMEQTWGFGILPGWVIPWNAGVRFLNTGPDIPHLVIATNTQGGRLLSDPVASLRTSSGSRLLKVRPLRSAGVVRPRHEDGEFDALSVDHRPDSGRWPGTPRRGGWERACHQQQPKNGDQPPEHAPLPLPSQNVSGGAV